MTDVALGDIFGLSRERIHYSGPEVEISPDSALPLSMILHELATNAVKYGALSIAEGAVAVNWGYFSTVPKRIVRLTWVERDGPAVTRPDRDGFGNQMISAAAVSLPSGRIETSYAKAGVTVSVTFAP